MVRASSRFSTVRFVSAYIPGTRMPFGFGTSTSMSMVLVDVLNVVADASDFSGENSIQRRNVDGESQTNPILGTTDSGTGTTSLSDHLSERTTGIACD